MFILVLLSWWIGGGQAGTVHSTALNLIPAVVAVNLELKFFVWVGGFADLVVGVDEVAVWFSCLVLGGRS